MPRRQNTNPKGGEKRASSSSRVMTTQREGEGAMIGQIWKGRYANFERTSSAVERRATGKRRGRNIMLIRPTEGATLLESLDFFGIPRILPFPINGERAKSTAPSGVDVRHCRAAARISSVGKRQTDSVGLSESVGLIKSFLCVLCRRRFRPSPSFSFRLSPPSLIHAAIHKFRLFSPLP